MGAEAEQLPRQRRAPALGQSEVPQSRRGVAPAPSAPEPAIGAAQRGGGPRAGAKPPQHAQAPLTGEALHRQHQPAHDLEGGRLVAPQGFGVLLLLLLGGGDLGLRSLHAARCRLQLPSGLRLLSGGRHRTCGRRVSGHLLESSADRIERREGWGLRECGAAARSTCSCKQRCRQLCGRLGRGEGQRICGQRPPPHDMWGLDPTFAACCTPHSLLCTLSTAHELDTAEAVAAAEQAASRCRPGLPALSSRELLHAARSGVLA